VPDNEADEPSLSHTLHKFQVKGVREEIQESSSDPDLETNELTKDYVHSRV
jgi:hypothetical protein